MSKHHYFIIALFIAYMVGMTAFMIWQGIGIAPDRYALVLLLGSLLVKKTRGFLLDWIPFLFILIAYDFLRSLAPLLNPRVNYTELIYAEQFIFHTIPTVALQQLFFNPHQISLLDYLATIFYFLHFALPLSFGFLLWMYNKSHFREFVTAILLMSYAAWISYVIFPSAPPWLAQDKGYLHGVTKIIDITLRSFPDKFNLPTIYHNFNPNPVAAFPSMHAAYPFLVLLFAISFFGKKGWFFLPYVSMVWFSMVYLGEHYVVDEIGGAIYAVVFFVLAKWILHNVKFHSYLKRSIWLKKVTGQILD